MRSQESVSDRTFGELVGELAKIGDFEAISATGPKTRMYEKRVPEIIAELTKRWNELEKKMEKLTGF